MSLSATQGRCLCCLTLLLFAICCPGQRAMAADAAFLDRVFPHISLHNKTPSQDRQSLSMAEDPAMDRRHPLNPKYLQQKMGDQDLFSLALGARFQISEWLGVDATCAMPLAEEETLWKQDLAIEAMVTMHF